MLNFNILGKAYKMLFVKELLTPHKNKKSCLSLEALIRKKIDL